MVQWFSIISWRLFDILTPYFGIMSQCDPMFDLQKCRSLWPIFHGPMILPYMLKSVWYMNIILQDYESVWPDIWPQNKCWSLWPIFHGPVILPYILKTICCMNIILRDYESVWHDIWPKNKCRSRVVKIRRLPAHSAAYSRDGCCLSFCFFFLCVFFSEFLQCKTDRTEMTIKQNMYVVYFLNNLEGL